MDRYVLTATLNGKTNAKIFQAEDTLEATVEAIHYILGRAYDDKAGPWAVGNIRLYDPRGQMIQEMEKK